MSRIGIAALGLAACVWTASLTSATIGGLFAREYQ